LEEERERERERAAKVSVMQKHQFIYSSLYKLFLWQQAEPLQSYIAMLLFGKERYLSNHACFQGITH
jgi:hypothetical protein